MHYVDGNAQSREFADSCTQIHMWPGVTLHNSCTQLYTCNSGHHLAMWQNGLSAMKVYFIMNVLVSKAQQAYFVTDNKVKIQQNL